mgnify:CR=1 FL=1
MNKKIIAVVLVVVLVAAGVAAAVYYTNNSKDNNAEYTINGGLEVYGNADGDYKIDSADLNIIKDIIAGNKTLSDYPYADANYDGSVDSNDTKLVQKIINGESCTIYNVNASSKTNYVVSTAWPVKSALSTGSSNNLLLLTMAGVADKIHGICYSSTPDPTLFPTFSKMTSLSTSSTKMSLDAASDIIKENKVTLLISDKTASTISNEPDFEKAGVDVVRIDAGVVDVDTYCSYLLLIGFLFQTDSDVQEVASWMTSLMNQVDQKVAGVADKATVVTTNGNGSAGAWVSAGISNYKDVTTEAGGVYAIPDKDLSSFSKYSSGAYFGSGDTWLYNYDFDYIISIRTNDWYSGTVNVSEKYAESMQYLTKTKAYENGNAYVMVGDGPIVLRVAYAASIMYPDLVSQDWVDSMNQEFFEKFYDKQSGTAVDFTDLFFVISKELADKASA